MLHAIEWWKENTKDVPPVGNDTLKVAEFLGVKLKKVHGGFMGCCPIHSDDTPSFHIYITPTGEDKGWYCFGCSRGGDAIQLLAYARQIDRGTAMQALYREADPAQFMRERLGRSRANAFDPDAAAVLLYAQVNQWLRHLRPFATAEDWREWAQEADAAVGSGTEGLFKLQCIHADLTSALEAAVRSRK